MTVFDTGPTALTMDFNAGDIGYVRRNLWTLCRERRRYGYAVRGRVPPRPRYEEVSLFQLVEPYAAGGWWPSISISTRPTIAKWPDNAPGVVAKS